MRLNIYFILKSAIYQIKEMIGGKYMLVVAVSKLSLKQ